MDLVNLIIDPNKYKTTCFLCFTQNEYSTCVYKMFEIIDKFSKNTVSIKDIMKKLFPFHDMVLAQVCEECTGLLIKIYTVFQRNHYKKKILNKIINILHEEISKKTIENEKELKINVKLPEYDNIESNDQEYNKSSLLISKKTCKNMDLQCQDFDIKIDSKTSVQERNALSHKNGNETTICDKCGKICSTPGTLMSHSNCHKVKQCPYCFKTLKTHAYFKLHVKKHVTNIKPRRNKLYYKCHDCNYKSINKKCLEAHINKEHLFLRPFKCKICFKGFYRKGNLNEHEKTHDKSKNNMCEICGENFVSKKTLLIHLKLHSDEKVYQCEICEKKFITSGQRLEHFKRTHVEKSVNCLICGKKFGLKKDLNRHLKRAHTQI